MKLIYRHFDILISQNGQVKQVLHFRALPIHCDCSILAHLHKDWALRHTSEQASAPQVYLNITQIHPDRPSDTPECSRQVKDTNWHQKTSPDILKHSKKSLGGWLAVVGAVWGCLVLSGGVLCCLELPGGIRGMSRVFWDAFLGALGRLRCLAGCVMEVIWALNPCANKPGSSNHNVLVKVWNARPVWPDHSEISKYQNVYISASRKWLSFTISLSFYVHQREIIKYSCIRSPCSSSKLSCLCVDLVEPESCQKGNYAESLAHPCQSHHIPADPRLQQSHILHCRENWKEILAISEKYLGNIWERHFWNLVKQHFDE